ncbi:MAG: rhodanese-like domain-containing protein [Sinobacterium sp.]|nr:rhodanese-like domain-containing protein [Sinobacterium sp.]
MIFEFLAEQYILVGAGLFVMFLLLKHENRKAGAPATPQMLSDLVNKHDGVVVDIREGKDFRTGHITDSIHIASAELDKHISELNAYKEKPVIVVCKTGHTAGAATKRLKEEGFTQVYKLSGGIGEWQASSLPLVK